MVPPSNRPNFRPVYRDLSDPITTESNRPWNAHIDRDDAMPTPFAQLGIDFAQALVDGDFDLAATCLAPQLRADLTPARLEAELRRMCEYGDGPPTDICYMPCEDALDVNGPDKQPGDLGWAYVAIEGDGYSEAVIVTVALVDGAPLIRDVEWGRP
jgi:hypothetical protein